MERLKRYGEMCGAFAAIWAVVVFLTAVVGGHLPPWATWAWAQTQEQLQQQNIQQIGQLNALMLSDKVSQLQSAVTTNPGDPNLRASLNYWQMQLGLAQAASMPRRK